MQFLPVLSVDVARVEAWKYDVEFHISISIKYIFIYGEIGSRMSLNDLVLAVELPGLINAKVEVFWMVPLIPVANVTVSVYLAGVDGFILIGVLTVSHCCPYNLSYLCLTDDKGHGRHVLRCD